MEKVSRFRIAGRAAALSSARANAAAIEHVHVEAYGQKQPLRNVAGISVQDARTIVVQPWDPTILQNVEKALQRWVHAFRDRVEHRR